MRRTILLLSLLAAACGGTTSGASSTEVRAFNLSAQGASAAAASYGTQAAAMTSATTCASAQATYVSQIQPMLDQMRTMGTSMDGQMGSMGHMADGDMECAANAMLAEGARHGSVACASATDMTPNKSEAAQHVATMELWANHQMVRSSAMGSMMAMGTGMMGGMNGGTGSTGHCVHEPDGSYAMQP
jgi:hypothetical protein